MSISKEARAEYWVRYRETRLPYASRACIDCGVDFNPLGPQRRCNECRTQTCPTCESEFVAERRGKVYCSRSCLGKSAANVSRLKSPEHPHKGKPRTYASRERTKHGSAEQREWRVAVFERDNYTCQMCGERGGRLEADHIKPFSTHPELRYELDNGRALCAPCHRTTPTYGWRGYWLKVRGADETIARRLAQDCLPLGSTS